MGAVLVWLKLLMWLAQLQRNIPTLEQFYSDSAAKLLISFEENTSFLQFPRLLHRSLLQQKIKLLEVYKKKEMFQASLSLIIKEAKCTTECRHKMTRLSSTMCYMATNQISDRYNYKTPKRKKECGSILSATKVPALGNWSQMSGAELFKNSVCFQVSLLNGLMKAVDS